MRCRSPVDVAGDVRAGAMGRGSWVVLGFADGRVERWSPAGRERVATSTAAAGAVVAVAVAGRTVVVLHDQSLVTRDLESLEEIARWSLAPIYAGVSLAKPERLWDRVRPLAVALSPDAGRAVVATSSTPSHHVVDLASGEVRFAGAFLEFQEACGAVAYAPDGSSFAAGALADGDYYVDVYLYRASDFAILGVSSWHCLH